MSKAVLISEEQERFLKENKGLLFEYYVQASNPKTDSTVLGNLQVWVYGDDRDGFTPHCHVMTLDKSTEFEVSLIDWSIINVKRGDPTRYMIRRFMKWLNMKSKRFGGLNNKALLYGLWDGTNPNNNLSDFCDKHGIIPTDKELLFHFENE